MPADPAKARHELMRRTAFKYADDPAALERAVRIVRAGLARGRIRPEDLTTANITASVGGDRK